MIVFFSMIKLVDEQTLIEFIRNDQESKYVKKY